MRKPKQTQLEKFKQAAREAGIDDSEERFNETLEDLAKSPRDAEKVGSNELGEKPKPEY